VIRVGFILDNSGYWLGGVNYFKNLFYAISTLDKPNIEIVVFSGTKGDKRIFGENVKVIEHKYFDKKNKKNILFKLANKYFIYTNFLLERFLKKNKIDVLSHSNIRLKTIKTISWIPDFQHLHLPQFFEKRDLNQRDKSFVKMIQKNDGIILSSYDALNDLKIFTKGQYKNQVFVLHFVSQPSKNYFELTDENRKSLLKKYRLSETFFYLPNQLWVHKNHITVFKAVKELKNRGISVCIVSTGNPDDYRNKKHIQFLNDYIKENDLFENIKMLGLIEYDDVFSLIRFSRAIINPSLFEGWSSTVEECKSVGKSMILSDLAVHKEQYPNAVFFEKENYNDLADKIENFDKYFKNSIPVFDVKRATYEFAKAYENIILETYEC